ncbi:MAG TPA: hypothetical protein VLC09_18415 [Polyangiaceae bacterium]|nr:hypothetical protein [Polyangiaceae bacterium]
MRPNWFIGFPFPGDFLAQLARPPGARLQHAEDVHLTLSFFGAVSEQAARAGWERLESLLEERAEAAHVVSLAEVLPMGSERSFSALAAHLGEGRGELERCLGEYRDAVREAAGLGPERRAPRPHVTLARPPRAATVEQRRSLLEWASGLELGGVRARLDRIALYTWFEPRGARKFRIVCERQLASGE